MAKLHVHQKHADFLSLTFPLASTHDRAFNFEVRVWVSASPQRFLCPGKRLAAVCVEHMSYGVGLERCWTDASSARHFKCSIIFATYPSGSLAVAGLGTSFPPFGFRPRFLAGCFPFMSSLHRIHLCNLSTFSFVLRSLKADATERLVTICSDHNLC